MKKAMTYLFLLGLFHTAAAQQDPTEGYERQQHHFYRRPTVKKESVDEDHGFDPSRIFVGGGVSLGYTTTTNGDNTTNNTFNIGAIPEVGYAVSQLLDFGIATSVNYTSTTNAAYDAKQHYTNYSLGAFVRVHPINNFFIQAMPEQDWGTVKQYSAGTLTTIYKIKSNNFLLGVGFGHRIIGEAYFYTLIMFDVIKDIYSPYYSYDANTGTVNVLPVLRGGFNFFPFRKNRK